MSAARNQIAAAHFAQAVGADEGRTHIAYSGRIGAHLTLTVPAGVNVHIRKGFSVFLVSGIHIARGLDMAARVEVRSASEHDAALQVVPFRTALVYRYRIEDKLRIRVASRRDQAARFGKSAGIRAG